MSRVRFRWGILSLSGLPDTVNQILSNSNLELNTGLLSFLTSLFVSCSCKSVAVAGNSVNDTLPWLSWHSSTSHCYKPPPEPKLNLQQWWSSNTACHSELCAWHVLHHWWVVNSFNVTSVWLGSKIIFSWQFLSKTNYMHPNRRAELIQWHCLYWVA